MIDNQALQSLEKLHQLKTDGVITAEDFEAAKERVLKAPASPAKPTRAGAQIADVEQPAEDNHLAWMLLPFKRYAQFTGRSSRKEFWMFLLLVNLVGAGLTIVALGDTNVFGGTGPVGSMAFGLIGLGFLGILVPLLAVEVRRFHDQGKSGWFTLMNLIPYIGPFVVLIFMLIQGGEGENEYGPDPRT